jgi:hypothetical protein
MPSLSRPFSCMRLIDTFRIPVSGSLATTIPAVMKGPASLLQWVTMGRSSRSTFFPFLATSFTGPAGTSSGGMGFLSRSNQSLMTFAGEVLKRRARTSLEPRILLMIRKPGLDAFSKRTALPAFSAAFIRAGTSNRGSTRFFNVISRSADLRSSIQDLKSCCILSCRLSLPCRFRVSACARLAGVLQQLLGYSACLVVTQQALVQKIL